ncbi:hypothetical protein [uncultured Sphingomonas sp.]|uniref:hypothetical protein n=1 Tax=uncultured Sphingomonas sp. TaxID=158754 RepID=UPI0035CB9CA1
MADLFQVTARLRALQRGQAVPIVSQRQVVIQPDARIITLLAMAGEDTSVHAAAIGRFGDAPQIGIVADPRRRDDQYGLLRWMLPMFETCYAECRAAGTFPQLWVSSAGALGHLDTLADRLRFTDEPDIQRLGELWTYAGERSPIDGQQALISASGALRMHFATGQQEAEDEHLGSLLTWIEPTPGRDIFAAVATAEEQPMGVKTDPRFDRRWLQPAIEDFHAAQEQSERSFHHARITQMLEGVLRPIHAATQRAYALLDDPRWRPNPALDALADQEAREFERFMAARDEGHHLPYRDKPKAGAIKIVARERAASNLDAGTLRHDRAARERGVGAGKVLRAAVLKVIERRIRPKLFEYTVELTTAQTGLHLREGDILFALDGPTISLRIDAVQRRGATTWIRATVDKGKRTVKSIPENAILDLGPEAPNWNGLGFELQQMSIRLMNPPWTHGNAMPAAAPAARPMPADLLVAVEGLT